LIEAFRERRAPAWETAFLLGCIGQDNGYETVREILQNEIGNLAEGYAGVALVRIRGELALGDLREVLLNASRLRTREGAAYGVGQIRTKEALALLVEAATTKRIRFRVAAGLLYERMLDPKWIATLLSSDDLCKVRLGTEIICRSIRSGATGEDPSQWLEKH